MQWGKGTTEETVQFPISFNSTPWSIVVFPGPETSTRYQNLRLSSLSKSSYAATMSGLNSTERFLVVGKQQWGQIDKGQDKSTSYPITFPVAIYSCVVTGFYNGNVEVYDTYIKSVTTSTLSTFVGGANHGSKFAKYYIVFGKQQWGCWGKYELVTIAFPLTFSNIFAIASSNGYNKRGWGSDCEPFGISNSNFQVYSLGDFRYIAVGKVQQWGVNMSNLPKDSNVVITYPVAFTTFASGVSQSIGVNSSWNFVQNDCSLTDITVQSQGAVRSKCWWIAIGK